MIGTGFDPAAVTERRWTYVRVGYDHRPLTLRPDGSVGEGAARCERYWRLEGETLILLTEDRQVIARLKPDGPRWHGTWTMFERMPVRLLPEGEQPGDAGSDAHLRRFTDAYARREWGEGSGEGSTPEYTTGYRDWLQRFLRDNRVRSVLDLGCGDWQFSRLLDWTGIDYTGVDAVAHLIEHNQSAYGGDQIRFVHADARDYPIGPVDLVIVKDVLQHWSNATVTGFLARLRTSDAKLALLVNCCPDGPNEDIADGNYRPLDLTAPPFKFAGTYVFSFRTKRALLLPLDAACPAARTTTPPPATSRKIILKINLSPGDVCTLTAAVESLHAAYPGRFLTDVRTSCDEVFEHNPHVTKLSEDEAEVIEMHYTDLINRCDSVPNAFLRGYCHDLGQRLGVPLELTTNRPHLYLTDEEKGWVHQVQQYFTGKRTKFWVVNAGVKPDYTLKQWPVEYYQEVVDHFRGSIQFVQVGSTEHDHPRLRNVIDLLGQTDHRELIRLCYHAQGGLGPISYLQHLCAAFEKPYVALLGGREPVSWVQHPLQTTLHTLGKLPCCRTASCWRSRVVRLNDGSEQDDSLCELPVLGMQRPVGKCMAIIRPVEVVRALEACYDGGALTY